MRKILKTLVASILLVACLFMVGCTKIPKDYKDARKNLIEANYSVSVVSSLGDTKELTEDLMDLLFSYDDLALLGEKYESLSEGVVDDYERDFEKAICAVSDGEFIIIVYFEDKESAKDFYEDCEDFLEEVSLLNYRDSLTGLNDGRFHGRSGKAVYFGTEGALEDLKG